MEFRLLYQGKLPSAGKSDSRIREKHQIRKQLHNQLKALWDEQPYFQRQAQDGGAEAIANKFKRCGNQKSTSTNEWFRFVPLIREDTLTCSLDILFLRRDKPGCLIRTGGDIDNRMKVLFDGLRVPSTGDELAGQVPDTWEDPFFCLMQDDALITEVTITTDRLLVPRRDEEHVNDVVLIILVKTKMLPNSSVVRAWQL